MLAIGQAARRYTLYLVYSVYISTIVISKGRFLQLTCLSSQSLNIGGSIQAGTCPEASSGAGEQRQSCSNHDCRSVAGQDLRVYLSSSIHDQCPPTQSQNYSRNLGISSPLRSRTAQSTPRRIRRLTNGLTRSLAVKSDKLVLSRCDCITV